jgi:uroporphyrinogen decarboxylase
MRRVLSGELPDRVPVLLQNFQNTAYLAGMSLREFCTSAEKMAEAQLSAWERFRYDVLDLENGTAAMAEALGCEVEYPQNQPPRVVKPALKRLEDVAHLKAVDPQRDGTLPLLLEATRRVRAGLGDRACIVGEADQGPFSLAGLLVGMEKWLLAVIAPDQRDNVVRLLEFTTEQVLRFALAQADAGADFTEIGDSLAGPDVCSPKVYRQFAWPYEQRIATALAAKGIPLILHICGNATPIVADMAATGAAMLEIDHKVDLVRCRQAAGPGTALVGTVDPSAVLDRGSVSDVLEHSRRAIRALGAQGAFVLSPGCTLPATVPPQNTAALVEASSRFGRYGPTGLLSE